MILEEEICDCPSVGRSSKEANKEGFITHGKLQGGCGLIFPSATFICASCDELSASKRIDHVRKDFFHLYYCDDCQLAFNLPPIDCSKPRCHNWPN